MQAQSSTENTVIEYFESNWKEGLTLNAAMKLGLEALRSANDTELNREAVEVTVVDGDGYRVLDRAEVNKQIDRLKPLEDWIWITTFKCRLTQLRFGDTMVSLDDAVLARMEKGGKRYELLVDPNQVDEFKSDPQSIDLNQFLAMDEVFHDIRGGKDPSEAIENTLERKIFWKLPKLFSTKGVFNYDCTKKSKSWANAPTNRSWNSHDGCRPETKSPHPKTR